ncbi:RDD family protein [Saccharomonospora sp. NPDC006951]
MAQNPHGWPSPQQQAHPQSPYAAQPPRNIAGPDGNGVRRGEVFLLRASAARRWWARIFDGVFVAVPAAAIIFTALVLGDRGQLSDSAGTILLFATYPAVLMIFGALYGCTCSPGQAMMGVVSLRSSSGSRVGFWRGMFRYLGVGLFPVTVVLLIMSILDMPVPYDEPVRVYRR